MRTIHDVAKWVEGAYEQFSDPSEPVGQVFCKWLEPLTGYKGDRLVAGFVDGEIRVRLGPGAMFPLLIEHETEGQIDAEGMPRFGARQVSRGLYYLTPSLYVPGMIHVFVNLYDVPDEPPWEKKILVVSGQTAFGSYYLGRLGAGR